MIGLDALPGGITTNDDSTAESPHTMSNERYGPMSIERDNMEFSNDSRSGAGSPETNGHNGSGYVDPPDLPADIGRRRLNERPPGEHNPFNSERANAKQREASQFGSPQNATVVGGLYVAEHGKAKLREGGYAAVAALEAVSVTDAKALGLLDHRPTEADVGRWYHDRGEEWVQPTKASVGRAGLQAATRGLDATRKVALTTIDALAAEGAAWAVSAAQKAAADNLDYAVKVKPYAFTLADLYNDFDAAVGDLVELPPMTAETRLASLRLLREWAAVDNFRAQSDARRRVAAAEAGHLTLPPVTNLDALLAKEDDPVRFRIDGVWPAGGAKVLCAAPAGGGKTTLSGNLVRALADGDPFLGKFTVNQTAQRIVVIDNEMTEPMLRRWLRRQKVRNTTAVADIVNLRGQAGLFDMSNDRLRGEWARRLRDLGCDVVIFDCLKPVLEAMGLDENRETGKFLYPFAEMLSDAGVEDVLVHHHMGHANERARGDSTLLGWTEANWKIVRKDDHPARPRFFSTDKVRDADEPVAEGLLSFDPATGHLTYVGGDRAATAQSENTEKRVQAVLDVLADKDTEGDGEMNVTEIKTAVGGKKEVTDEALTLAEKRGLVTRRQRGRSKLYRINPKARDPLFMGDERDRTADGGVAPATSLRQPRDSGPTGQ